MKNYQLFTVAVTRCIGQGIARILYCVKKVLLVTAELTTSHLQNNDPFNSLPSKDITS
jgi:hypothetical protein